MPATSPLAYSVTTLAPYLAKRTLFAVDIQYRCISNV